MATATPQVLNRETRKQIDAALKKCQEVLGVLTQIEACGKNCDEWRAKAQCLHDEFTRLLTNLYAGKPPGGAASNGEPK